MNDAPSKNIGTPPPRHPGWSLHRRLIIGLIASIGGVFAIVAPALDFWIDREVYQRMDLSLQQRAMAVERLLNESRPGPIERLMPEYARYGHTEFFTVFDANGEPILRSPNSAGSVLPRGPQGLPPPHYYDVRLPDGHSGRALATRLPAHEDGTSPNLLVVATERESWDSTERRIHLALFGGIALATLLAAGLSLLIVQRMIQALRRAGAIAASLRPETSSPHIEGRFPRELQPFVDALNQGLSQLYTAIERERRFSRDVAHELRTPLAEIRTSAESALADSDPSQAHRSLKAAIAACARMQRSVDTLLLLARLESGQHTPAPDPLDLAELLRDLLSAQRAIHQDRQLTVSTLVPSSAWVQSDLGIIERVISNLLSNAFEYSPDGEEIICLLDRDDTGWSLSISNAAPELETADLEQFGHRFWRKRPEGGTARHAGLGLALSIALARAIQLPLHFDLDEGRLVARLGPWPALL